MCGEMRKTRHHRSSPEAVFCTEQIYKLRKVPRASTATYPYIDRMCKEGKRCTTNHRSATAFTSALSSTPAPAAASRGKNIAPLHQHHAVSVAIGGDPRNDASLQPREQWSRAGAMVIAAGSQSAHCGATP